MQNGEEIRNKVQVTEIMLLLILCLEEESSHYMSDKVDI